MVASALAACGDSGKISADRAREHVAFLAKAVVEDVDQVRQGLAPGADVVGSWWKSQPLEADLRAAQDSLEAAKRKVGILRLAKSTFFALTSADGVVIRNDQEQDRMAGKALFPAYPALMGAKERYTEAQGSLPEASGVRAPRPDGQWVAGVPIRVDGALKGLYVTGWAWTSYAYRLEFAIRGKVRAELAASKKNEKEPLLYVYVLVDHSAFGAPVSPEVNAAAIVKLDALSKPQGDQPYVDRIEIEGRVFGLAVQKTPALGGNVGIAVLRSET